MPSGPLSLQIPDAEQADALIAGFGASHPTTGTAQLHEGQVFHGTRNGGD
jgi:hypothetical protein